MIVSLSVYYMNEVSFTTRSILTS